MTTLGYLITWFITAAFCAFGLWLYSTIFNQPWQDVAQFLTYVGVCIIASRHIRT